MNDKNENRLPERKSPDRGVTLCKPCFDLICDTAGLQMEELTFGYVSCRRCWLCGEVVSDEHPITVWRNSALKLIRSVVEIRREQNKNSYASAIEAAVLDGWCVKYEFRGGPHKMIRTLLSRGDQQAALCSPLGYLATAHSEFGLQRFVAEHNSKGNPNEQQ